MTRAVPRTAASVPLRSSLRLSPRYKLFHDGSPRDYAPGLSEIWAGCTQLDNRCAIAQFRGHLGHEQLPLEAVNPSELEQSKASMDSEEASVRDGVERLGSRIASHTPAHPGPEDCGSFPGGDTEENTDVKGHLTETLAGLVTVSRNGRRMCRLSCRVGTRSAHHCVVVVSDALGIEFVLVSRSADRWCHSSHRERRPESAALIKRPSVVLKKRRNATRIRSCRCPGEPSRPARGQQRENPWLTKVTLAPRLPPLRNMSFSTKIDCTPGNSRLALETPGRDTSIDLAAAVGEGEQFDDRHRTRTAVVTHGGRQDSVIDQEPRGGCHNVTDRVVNSHTRHRVEPPPELEAAFDRAGGRNALTVMFAAVGGEPTGSVLYEKLENVSSSFGCWTVVKFPLLLPSGLTNGLSVEGAGRSLPGPPGHQSPRRQSPQLVLETEIFSSFGAPKMFEIDTVRTE